METTDPRHVTDIPSYNVVGVQFTAGKNQTHFLSGDVIAMHWKGIGKSDYHTIDARWILFFYWSF